MIVPKRNESNADLIAYDYGLIVTTGAIQKIIMIAQGNHLLIFFVLLLRESYPTILLSASRKVQRILTSIPLFSRIHRSNSETP